MGSYHTQEESASLSILSFFRFVYTKSASRLSPAFAYWDDRLVILTMMQKNLRGGAELENQNYCKAGLRNANIVMFGVKA